MKLPGKILIVDDDPEDQEFLLEALTEIWPQADNVTKNDGAEALEYIEKNPPPPSIIFLDLNMPLVNGFEFLSKYKKNSDYHQSHIIIYTTSSHPHDKAKTKELGANHYLTKVADMGVLKKKIRQAVENVF